MASVNLEVLPIEKWGIFDSVKRPIIIAGPCSAENEAQVMDTARELKECGVKIFRAGIWKPRTRPNCFEGIGIPGLAWLRRVKEELGMVITTEVANAGHVEEALKAGVDILWVGARTAANPFSVQNIAEALRGVDVPVFLKNPVNPDVDLWIGALERLNIVGVKRLGAIHRGFSTYGANKYRNMPQWQIPIELRRLFPHLPILVDPSHMAGCREYVPELSQKAMDLGFDGLMIESHNAPDVALSDSKQQLTPPDLKKMLDALVIRSHDTEDSEYRESIDELRSRIDEIDVDIINMLSRRMGLSEQIGYYKKRNNITVLQTGRWEEILSKVHALAQEKRLEADFIDKIFMAVHQASIDCQTHIMNESGDAPK